MVSEPASEIIVNSCFEMVIFFSWQVRKKNWKVMIGGMLISINTCGTYIASVTKLPMLHFDLETLSISKYHFTDEYS